MKPSIKIISVLLLFMNFNSYSQQYWHRVGGGLGQVGTGEVVVSLLNDTINHLLYASGNFNEADDTIGCSGVVNWDSQNWTTNTNFNSNPSTKVLGFFQGKIFIGTTNQNTGNVAYNLSGTTWASAGYMNDGGVSCLCVYHNKLYAGGRFTNVDGIPATFIACYDGANWSEPGGGIWCTQFPGDVSAMCVWNDKLIVGGNFNQAGGVFVHSVAAWNDTTWSDVGGGGN